MILRNFLYLDSAAMADYLSALDGSVVEGPVDHTLSAQHGKGITADLKVVKGDWSRGGTSETKETRLVTDAAKFLRLYELIKEENLQYLDAFDEAIWNQIERGELLEIQAKIDTPEFCKLTQALGTLLPLVEVVKAFDESWVDAKTESAMKSVDGLSKILEAKPLPMLFEAASTPGFRFVADLKRQYLRCDMSDLQGEATVLGKVQRVLGKGQTHEAFSLLPASLSKLNTKAIKKAQRDLKDKKVSQTVRGPGAVIAALAVYR